MPNAREEIPETPSLTSHPAPVERDANESKTVEREFEVLVGPRHGATSLPTALSSSVGAGELTDDSLHSRAKSVSLGVYSNRTSAGHDQSSSERGYDRSSPLPTHVGNNRS